MHMLPVPRVPCVCLMSLRTPRLIRTDLLPTHIPGVVARLWRSPSWIIAEVKLPQTIEWCSVFAEILDREYRGAGLCNSTGRRGNESKKHQPYKGQRTTGKSKHAKSILP